MSNVESTVCFFKDLHKTLSAIPDADAGILMKALFAHANELSPEGLDKSVIAAALYIGIADQIDRIADFRNKKAENRKKKEQSGTKGNELEQTRTNGNKTEQTGYPYPYPNPIKEKESPSEIGKRKAEHFVPPTVEDVEAYAREKGLVIEAERFVDFYTSKGWKVGSSPMKDYKAAIRNWCSRRTQSVDKPKPAYVPKEERGIKYDDITRDLFLRDLKGG